MSVLAAALLIGVVASDRRVERELPAAFAAARVAHAYGECKVVPVGPREKPRARLDLTASGVGDGVAARFLEEVSLDVETVPATSDSPAAVVVRSRFPPKERQPEGLSRAGNLTLFVPEGTALEIENAYGRVVVDGRGDERPSWRLRDVKVTNKLGAVELRGIQGTVRVDSQFDAIRVADVSGDAILRGKSCAVTAERVGGLVDVITNGGEVRVEGAGSARIENKMKPVELRDVRGDAHVIAPFCAVTARETGGSLTIESSNASVVVAEVGGDLTIQHRGGTIDARAVKGKATIAGNLADVTLVDVAGGADVRSASALLKLQRISGKLVAENSARTLEIVDARGAVEASALGGLLKASFARLTGPRTIELESEAGGIELELPHEAGVELEATSTAGQIDCAIPGMTFEQTGAARVGRLRLGAAGEKKATLHATSVGGAIRVRRAPR